MFGFIGEILSLPVRIAAVPIKVVEKVTGSDELIEVSEPMRELADEIEGLFE